MDPNQPQPGQQPGTPPPQNPYGFIMDTEHQKKRGSLTGGNNSFRSRVLLLLGGATLLIIAVIVVSSLLSGKGSGNAQLLTDISGQQTEIIRVSGLGLKSATDPSTLALAETTLLSVQSQRSQLNGYLSKNNVKVTPELAAAYLNKETDKALASAMSSNKFDETFTKVIKDSLTTYLTSIEGSYLKASNEESKKILSDSFDSTKLLLK